MGYGNGMGRLQVVRSPEPDAAPRDMAKRIGILIFEDFSLVEVSSISEVFFFANQLRKPGADAPNYSLLFLSSDGGSVASSCSMRIWTESLENRWMNDCDALFIAGGQGAQHARHDSVLRKRLGRVAPKIPFVKAIGEGSQILAAANLTLQNRSLDFAEEPATASALANSLFIAEQTLTLDDPKGPIAAALSIIKRDYGAAIAREVSERSIPGRVAKALRPSSTTPTAVASGRRSTPPRAGFARTTCGRFRSPMRRASPR